MRRGICYDISQKEMIKLKKSLGTILTALRREAGLTQPRVSELLSAEGIDIKPAGISKWEKDMTLPNAVQFLALCGIYGVIDVMSTFTGSGGSTAGLNSEGRRLVADYIRVLLASGLYSEERDTETGRVLPLYTLAASAGTGQFLDGDDCEPIDASAAPEEADFAVRIAGDSMEPEISNGQIVWVRRRETLESGRTGIFVLGGMAYCKRLHVDEKGACLISVNPAYAPIMLTPESEFRVCGEVVG